MFNSFEISINVNWIMISPVQPSSSQLYSIKVHCHGRFISTIPAWDSWKLERSTQICKQIEGSLAVSLDATSVIPSNTFSRNTCLAQPISDIWRENSISHQLIFSRRRAPLLLSIHTAWGLIIKNQIIAQILGKLLKVIMRFAIMHNYLLAQNYRSWLLPEF